MNRTNLTISESDKSWEELIRADMRLYTVAFVLKSVKYSNLEIGGPKYRSIMLYFKNNVAYYYENFQDHHRIGKYILEKFISNRTFFHEYTKKWKLSFRNYQNTILKIRKTNIAKLTNGQIGEWIKSIYDQASYFHGMAYNVDAIDITLNPVLEKEVEKLVKGKIDSGARKSIVTEYYNKLTYPNTPTFSWQKEFDLLKLVDLNTHKKLDESDLKGYVEKYYWAACNWGVCRALTIAELKKQIIKTAKLSKKSPKDLARENKNHLKEKNKILEELKPSATFLKLLEIFDVYANLHDLRKETQVKTVYYLDRLMMELTRRFKISLELLSYAWPEELIELAKTGNINFTKLKKRSDESLIIYTEKAVREYYGKQAGKLRDEKLKINIKKRVDLQGIVASKGRVIGIVRVCLGGNEANKSLKNGEILVTGMTTPDFVPAMRRASAIVTDEGGLTCHAAIISRELGVPCIVGTKLGTRMLKNGDKVEVNANHGTVKIL